MDPDSSRQLVFILVLISFSAFFSASETALTSLSKMRLRNMVDEGIKNAGIVKSLLDNPSKLLTTILVGNNLVNISASALATAWATARFGSGALGIVTGVMTLLVLIFGEVTPKTFAAQNSEKISLFVAKPIIVCVYILTPIVVSLNFIIGVIMKLFGRDNEKQSALITESEFKTIVDVSHEEGVLEIDEREMINNVVDFGNSDAKDVSTPRTDIMALPLTASYEETMKVFKEEHFSRVPIYDKNIDDIVGILSLKDFMFIRNEGEFRISDYMWDPYFTYESKPSAELFAQMRKKRVHMAIILDEYGGTSGLVTLEDLIEEIVGDIADEFDDNEDEIALIKEDEYIVDGSAKIADVNEMIGTSFVSEDFESIGGYVTGIIGRIPISGEVVENADIKFVIEEIGKNRIEKLRIIM